MNHHLAIFASGAGSNAGKIIDHFRNHPQVSISLVVANKEEAGVLDIARENQIKYLIINKKQLNEPGFLEAVLSENRIDFIVLAGFLLKIPDHLINAFPRRIINIHPALLPAFGGKGMYGKHVHEAVLLAKEKESGITIHYVDNQYDHGETIFQARVNVDPDDSPESLARKIQVLEHRHYPLILEQVLQNQR